MSFALQSPAFPDGRSIPRRYARDGGNVSPPLVWQDAPEETKSFLLVVDDPDAPSGVFHHWLVYDMDARSDRLAEDATAGVANGSLRQAVNDFGNRQYDGPQPPRGDGPHHYHFRLLALDVERLNVPDGASIREIMREASSHLITETETVGTFEAA
ncbi:YbhB/YbcL family Raf kinase inhibitor-like protein [Nitratireductor sp. ZSWI3]|uniref:YbhB/YbcL family Raf kinase inhibitor-like protein n=1 Tax=Nitratireductor sp. ZSWI3 TaxID=2966359 RepID=UPI00215061A4|nr:YbhB/YbcL family Raf kinase inhibitor-like protein [Nitratireductor sp. ZSWI3]MCR4264658.1 YbhB/YbcL family Raf kinase inhibitor-like protein [Nitratireductor sp. ZSWI3]